MTKRKRKKEGETKDGNLSSKKIKNDFLKLTMQQVHTQGRIMHEFRQSHPRI